MDSQRLVALLWGLAGRELTVSQALVAIAVLACNLNGAAARWKHLTAHIKQAPRSTERALAALVEDKILEMRGDSYAFPTLTSVFARQGAPEVPTAASADPTQVPADPTAASGAQKAVKDLSESNNNALKNNYETTAIDPVTLTALAAYAELACRIEKGVVVVVISHLVKTFGLDRSIAALEQYEQDYTAIGLKADNPSGQLISWCRDPKKMRGLAANALKFDAWAKRRAALESKPALDTSTAALVEGSNERKRQDELAREIGKSNRAGETLSAAENRVLIETSKAFAGDGRGPTPEQFNAAREARAKRLASKGLTPAGAKV